MSLRDEYPRSALFRVIAEGGRLDGMQPMKGLANAFSGWKQDLHVGDVIECLGVGPGWGSDPGYGVHWTSEKVRADHVSFAEFRPSAGGLFDYHPADGFLEPVTGAGSE